MNLVPHHFLHFLGKCVKVIRNTSWNMRTTNTNEAWETFEPRRDRHRGDASDRNPHPSANRSGGIRSDECLPSLDCRNFRKKQMRIVGPKFINFYRVASSMTRAFWLSSEFANKKERGNNRSCHSKHLCRGRDTAR